MDDTGEQKLARGLREGKIEAWRELYEAYARPVWQSVARQMGPESSDVADVVQETFLAAARSARTYDPERGSIWLWLMGIARRNIALHYRKRERQDRVKDAAERLGPGHEQVVRWLENRHPTPPEALAATETAVLVRAALTELPTNYETLLTARYLDDTSVETLAETHRCSPTALRSKLARARRAFRDVFTRFTKTCPISPES